MYLWQTAPNGVETLVDDGSGLAVWRLHPKDAAELPPVLQWAALARPIAQANGIHLAWVLGIVFAESRGKPTVRSSCCLGLLGLNPKYYAKDGADLFDPKTNLERGVKALGLLAQQGLDLPNIASIHNGGQYQKGANGQWEKCPKACAGKSQWGLRQEEIRNVPGGYIEVVVRAANSIYEALRGQSSPPGPPPPPTTTPPKPAGATGVQVASWGLGLAAAWYWMRRWLGR